jgi:hypothetical protein
MSKKLHLSESRSIHDLEAGLRHGRWIGVAAGDQTGLTFQAVRDVRKARRGRKLAAARGQLRRFGGARPIATDRQGQR